jgi:hypothetical protein
VTNLEIGLDDKYEVRVERCPRCTGPVLPEDAGLWVYNGKFYCSMQCCRSTQEHMP